MQYTLTLTPRMLTISSICLLVLCALLFLFGVEIGKKLSTPIASASPITTAPVNAKAASSSALDLVTTTLSDSKP